MTRYYLQQTTAKLHAVKSCSITSRTRYDHFEVELTDAEAAHYTLCSKCFDTEKPAPKRAEKSNSLPDYVAQNYMTDDVIVSYEDMANPRRVGTVVEHRAGEFRVMWDDEDGGETWSDLRQAGWNLALSSAWSR